MKIEYQNTHEPKDVEFLTQKINEETLSFGSAKPFAFFIRDKNNQIIAGCNGYFIYGSIYTDQLWVNPSHRKLGLAKSLMEKVHIIGRKARCRIATVSTMSFQNAKNFYEKLGYEVDFERAGYVNDSKFLFLKREL